MNAPLLTVEGLEAVYERTILALRGVSLRIEEGSIVALLGANGAGKTTTLKAISNLIRPEGGEVTRGTVTYAGRDITHADPADVVEAGIVQVLEGRHCFPHLSTEENLLMGAVSRSPSKKVIFAELEWIYHHFPRLAERRRSKAGYLSGGEQQMLAIGRALMARPKLVLLDEPSMGLAPKIFEEILEVVRGLNQTEGVTFLLAEQNAATALDYADYGYVLENGRVPIEGPASELAARQDVQSFYLGGDINETPSSRRARRPEFRL
jgi:branched-chain amino acid transport system ATP-binding protein